MHEELRDRTLRRLGRLVTTHPWRVLVPALLAAVTCVVATALHLEFRSDRSDLIDRALPWNRRYAEYRESFPRWDDLVVVLEGAAGDTRIDDLARRVADALRAEPAVRNADAGFALHEAGPRLFRVAEAPVFERRLDELVAARTIVAAPNANALLAAAATALQRDATDDTDPVARLRDLLAPYIATLRGEPPSFEALLPATADGWRPLAGPSGRLRFVLVDAADSDRRTVDRVSALLEIVRGTTAGIVDAAGVDDLQWGVTGIPAIEADETRQSIRDSTVASVVAMVLITLLMLAVFRGVTLPLLAAGSLLVGVAWSFGWLLLTVGHLQLLSVVFTVILLGLGIDFALHLVARLELVQDEHEDLAAAIARVLGGIGPGLVTGAVTTAAAFGAVALTEFRGMAEMGVIAAGGILLCLVAMCVVFPAALAATGRWKSIVRARRGGEAAHFAHGRLDLVDARPRRTLLVGGLVVAALAVAAGRVRYDPNVLNLHPPGIESVRWERRIVDEGGGDLWAALILVDPDPAAAADLADRLRARPEVGAVGGMGVLHPPDRDRREALVAAARAAPLPPNETGAGWEALRGQLAAVRTGLARRTALAEGGEQARLRAVLDELTRALVESSRVPPEQAAVRWSALDDAARAAAAPVAVMVDEALAPGPLGADDLPPVLREQWVGRDGRWLLRANPADVPAGRSILDPARLEPFVAAVLAVDPGAMGPPVQIQHSSDLIVREYVKAAIYAIVAILVILLLDFRSAADALCALVPVTIGFVGAFGALALLGATLNFANIIVMPIIFGIGVDAGVHVVHRWRAEPAGRPAGLSGGTGRGVTLTMATTIIGFGCMLLAEHRGIRSLGLLMVAGLAVTLVACFTILPALLRHRGCR